MPTSPEPGSHQSYEAQERRRMLTALAELRSCCKTEKARGSLEAFERSMKHNMAGPGLVNTQNSSDPEHQVASVRATARTRQTVGHSRVSETSTLAPGLVAPASTRRSRPPLPLPNIWERLSLTKSKTTGNLADLSDNPAVGAPRCNPPPRPVITWHHRRQSSTQSIAQNIPAAVVEGQDEPSNLSTTRIPASHRRHSSNVTMSSMSRTKTGSTWGAATPRKTPMCHCRTSSGSFGPFDEMHPGVTVASIESGHPPAPRPPPTSTKSLPSPKTQDSSMNSERYVKSRREKYRRSSGEAMKDLWQAGVDQVKKMGKRVGGSGSWATSNEDFDRVVSVRKG